MALGVRGGEEDVVRLRDIGLVQRALLLHLLGRARAKKGMFEGDMEEGELEIGQVSGLIHEIKPAADIVADLMAEFNKAKTEVQDY